MRTLDLIEGLQILHKYRRNPLGCYVSADYNVIYAFATDFKLSKSDLERMITLGWKRDVKNNAWYAFV